MNLDIIFQDLCEWKLKSVQDGSDTSSTSDSDSPPRSLNITPYTEILHDEDDLVPELFDISDSRQHYLGKFVYGKAIL